MSVWLLHQELSGLCIPLSTPFTEDNREVFFPSSDLRITQRQALTTQEVHEQNNACKHSFAYQERWKDWMPIDLKSKERKSRENPKTQTQKFDVWKSRAKSMKKAQSTLFM